LNAHPHNNPDQSDVTTQYGVSLPSLGEWLADVQNQSRRAQRQAVRAILPTLATMADSDRDQWRAAIIDAGIYTQRGLTRVEGEIARATPPAETPPQADSPAETPSQVARPATDVSPVPDSEADPDSPADTGATVPGQSPTGTRTVPGSRWSYRPGAGVWDANDYPILDWCPTVTRNLVGFDSSGEVIGQHVSLSVPPYSATVPMSDVDSGDVWLAKFPNAAGVAERRVKETLRNLITDQANQLPVTPAHPRWTADGRLEVPPADALARGYGDTAGSWDEWCDLVARTRDTPQIALVLALSAAGLYVQPLGDESYVVHLQGASSKGKTTTAVVAASLFGNPANVKRPWNVTPKGLLAWLRGMACLTGYRDEIEQAGFKPGELSKTMFDATSGAGRDMSSRGGQHRPPEGDWYGCLISTGNQSVLGQIDNEATAARIVEMSTPFTDNGTQAETFEGIAREHYGHGLAAIAEHGPTPHEFGQWARKAHDDLQIPSGGVTRRIGRHLANGVAGARMLEHLTGVSGYTETVTTAASAVLADLTAGLTERGSNPATRLLAAIEDVMSRRPGSFPTRTEYEYMVAQQIRLPEILGWDLSSDSHVGDVALTSGGIKAVAYEGDITDTTIALRELRSSGQLHRNERSDEDKRVVKISGKTRKLYVISGLWEDQQDNDSGNETVTTNALTPSTADETGSVTGSVTGHVTENLGSDQERYGVTGSAENSTCRDRVTVADYAPCVRCGNPTLLRFGGEPNHYDPCPTHSAENATQSTEHHRDGDSTEHGGRTPHSANQKQVAGHNGDGSESSQVSDSEELENWQRWLAKAEIGGSEGVSEEFARRALDRWHAATDTLRWVSYPGEVGTALYYRLTGRHSNMPRPDRCENELVHSISTGGMLVRHLDYVDPEIIPETGQKVTGHDINKQFLAAAGTVHLGDGEPVVYTRTAPPLESLVKFPGYVELRENLDSEHPALRGIEAGRWVPMPLVSYLLSRGVTVTPARVVVWQEHGQRLAKHAKALRTAWQTLATADDAESAVAASAVKAVYAAFYGGMLRSEDYNRTGTMRVDWSDQLIAVSWANALRGLDRATYGVPLTRPDGKATTDADVRDAMRVGEPITPPLGICRDTAWWLADSAPWTPDGLQVSEQPGKWKVEKWGEVTDQLIHGHRSGSPYLVRNAVNAADTARQGGDTDA